MLTFTSNLIPQGKRNWGLEIERRMSTTTTNIMTRKRLSYSVYRLAHFQTVIYYEAEEYVWDDSDDPVSIGVHCTSKSDLGKYEHAHV